MSLESLVTRSWYEGRRWLYLLLPLSWLYRGLMSLRRSAYQRGWKHSFRAPVPVIVVGNLTVGGAGKTPLVIALVERLQVAGYRPGVISRGYGGQAASYPLHVDAGSAAREAGDEPVLIAMRTGAPVVVDPQRTRGVTALLEMGACDVVVADDGLQHLALQRDIEIVVVDGHRLYGNSFCLPAGPLREPVSRLATVDFVCCNGDSESASPTAGYDLPSFTMLLQAAGLREQVSGKLVQFEQWQGSTLVHAIAAIGNPQRFFDTLRQLGFTVVEHAFPDHYQYSDSDLTFDDDLPVIVTEKDVVKLQSLSISDRLWVLPVTALLEDSFFTAIIEKLQLVTPSD